MSPKLLSVQLAVALVSLAINVPARAYRVRDDNLRATLANLNCTEIAALNTANVTNITNMLSDLPNFDCDISHWNVSSVTTMDYAFAKAVVGKNVR